MVLRMDISTCQTFCKSCDESSAGTHAGMHVKPYDTHAVPYCQKGSRHIHQKLFHTGGKGTNFPPILKIHIFCSNFAIVYKTKKAYEELS